MEFFRNNILFRLVCFLLAVHIFNVSVDMPDANPDSVAEDLTINDQESVVELILEKCLGIDDAIAEHDEPDNDNRDIETAKVFKVYHDLSSKLAFFNHYIELKNEVPSCSIYISQYVNDITHPPPQA